MNIRLSQILFGVLAFSLSLLSSAGASTIDVLVDFDDQVGGIPPVVNSGTFNPHVTFSTTAGSELVIFAGAGVVGASGPNAITATTSPTSDTFDSDIFIDFTNPVDNFSFLVASDNDSGDIATLRVFTEASGAIPADNFAISGNGNFSDPIPIDLTAHAGVTRVEVVNVIDEFGLVYDDLSFRVSGIPEPSTLCSLLVASLCLLASRRR